MKKQRIIVCIIAIVVVMLIAVSIPIFFWMHDHPYIYQEEQIMGLTSAEVEKKYGSFDCVSKSPDADGLYKKAACSYFITEEHKGFFGTIPPKMFTIIFDENGIASQFLTEDGGKGG